MPSEGAGPDERALQPQRRPQEAVAALDVFCAAREAALDSIAGGMAGWEPALEELLRATDDVDDYCEGAGESHDHTVDGSRTAPAASPITLVLPAVPLLLWRAARRRRR